MSIRITLVYLFVAFLSIYAWKDWFIALCGLILMTVIMGHPDFPESFGNIQGLNVWNILFADIFLAFLASRCREGLSWDMPKQISILLLLWLLVILIGWVWMVVDRRHLEGHTFVDFISEQLINTIKWPLPGLLLFIGCRTKRRIKTAFACIIILFAGFSIQIARAVPSKVAVDPGNLRARREIPKYTIASPNGAGKMMSGVPLAMLTVMPLLKRRRHKFLMIGLSTISAFALALAGSRGGYVACLATGFFLCFIRWRKYLLLYPLMLFLMPIALPGATSRMLSGFGTVNVAGEEITDEDAVTSGRDKIWPVVISKIFESPVFGFGREAMRRTGLEEMLENKYGKREGVAVNHPHNAYLEVLLDSGLIGFVIIIGLYTYIWIYAVRLFIDRGDPIYTATGGFALALLTGHLVANMCGQSFYVEEIHIGLWCSIGLMLRMYKYKTYCAAATNKPKANYISAPYEEYNSYKDQGYTWTRITCG